MPRRLAKHPLFLRREIDHLGTFLTRFMAQTACLIRHRISAPALGFGEVEFKISFDHFPAHPFQLFIVGKFENRTVRMRNAPDFAALDPHLLLLHAHMQFLGGIADHLHDYQRRTPFGIVLVRILFPHAARHGQEIAGQNRGHARLALG